MSRAAFLQIRIVLICLCLAVAVTLTLFHDSGSVSEKSPGKPDYAALRIRWKKDIDAHGVQEAYEHFKHDGEGYPFGTQHAMAHIFGALIYDKEGVGGIAVCDPTFSFGCYHSLAGKAIIEQGLSIVKDLDAACNTTVSGRVNIGCLHGIGHGILGYVGYDNVAEALEACRVTSWHKPLGGCPGGVFMENNFHTMESVESSKARVATGDLYAPCDALSSDFTQECYYYQALWWVRALSSDFDTAHMKAGELCDAVSGADERKACFWGLGESAVSQSRSIHTDPVDYCKRISGLSAQLYCREGVRRTLFANTVTRADAPKACDGLSSEAFKVCLDPSVLDIPIMPSEGV